MIKKYTINTTKTISETLDNETIIINLEKGTYYSMNAAGTGVWNAIIANNSINTEASGVIEFINQLIADELIQEVSLNDTSDTDTHQVTEIPILTKYTDMQEMLLADPIHDVEEMGWPKLKEDH